MFTGGCAAHSFPILDNYGIITFVYSAGKDAGAQMSHEERQFKESPLSSINRSLDLEVFVRSRSGRGLTGASSASPDRPGEKEKLHPEPVTSGWFWRSWITLRKRARACLFCFTAMHQSTKGFLFYSWGWFNSSQASQTWDPACFSHSRSAPRAHRCYSSAQLISSC